jgi:hypothetical protein
MFENAGYQIERIADVNKADRISLRWRLTSMLCVNALRDSLYQEFPVVGVSST